jgi:hypothetical protein
MYNLEYSCAAADYDEASGWVSINMLQMAWALTCNVRKLDPIENAGHRQNGRIG